MGIQTDIEYADSTLNLMMGCAGCELWRPQSGIKDCYAGVLTERYGGVNKGFPAKFEEPKLFLDRLDLAVKWKDLTGTDRSDKPWLNGMPRIIFLNDMGDTFTESLPIDWLAPLLPRIADSPHQWLLLTKRPGRMAEFSKEHPLPPNVWPGASVTSSKTISRIQQLLQIQGGGPRWLSCEPLWSEIDLEPYLYAKRDGCTCDGEYPPCEVCNALGPLTNIQWVVGGGQSGSKASPTHPMWARQLCEHCGDTSFFWKQWGEWSPLGFSNQAQIVVCADTGESWPAADHQSACVDHNRLRHNGESRTPPHQIMYRVGKHAAGRMLDGSEWSEMPRLEVLA